MIRHTTTALALLVTVVKLVIRRVIAPAAQISQQPVPDQFSFGSAGIRVGRVGMKVVRFPILLVGRVVLLRRRSDAAGRDATAPSAPYAASFPGSHAIA